MVKTFARSISFPAPKTQPPPPASPCRCSAAAARSSYRSTRSASLPTRLHPLSAYIDADLDALVHWSTSNAAASSSTAVWLVDGLSHLHLLLAALSDVLDFPHAQDTLQRLFRRHASSSPSASSSSVFAEWLLEDLLRLADAHSSFRSAAIDLKHQLSATHAALRRRRIPAADGVPGSLSSCIRSQRLAEMEVSRLASSIRDVGKKLPVLSAAHDAGEAEVAGVMRQVMKAAAGASAAIFSAVAAMSMAAVTTEPPVAICPWAWVEAALRWRARARARVMMKKKKGLVPNEKDEVKDIQEDGRKAALEKLEALEDCVVALETESEKVFRALVNTRVSLLNIQTPGF